MSKECPRKVYISFLGTTNYVLCNYYFDGNENGSFSDEHLVKNVRHVQEAIVRHECKGWTENDRILIFLTEAAKKANWEDGEIAETELDEQAAKEKDSKWGKPGDEKWGLCRQLKNLAAEGLFPESIIKPVENVDDGVSEKAIWSLFNQINEQIEENDEIYFDFTSGFRNLSVLGMVLLTYLKNTKNVSVGEIYYGAFEKLGFASNVKKLEMKDRNAPVLKLKALSDIMDFSSAAKTFVKYGNAELLKDCIVKTWKGPKTEKQANEEIGKKEKPKLTEFEQKLRMLSNNLNEISMDLQTCRGGKICDGTSFKKLKDTFESLEKIESESGYKALGPILKLIKTKFERFSKEKDVLNGLTAARWCFENGMYQQSATMLQESIVSYCVSKVLPYDDDKKCQTYEALDCRELIENYLQYDFTNVKKQFKKSRVLSKQEFDFIDKIDKLDSIKESDNHYILAMELKKFNDEKTLWKAKLETLVHENECFDRKEIEENLEKINGFRSIFPPLSKLRNNLNHAGFLAGDNYTKKDPGENQKNTTAQKIKKQLEEFIGKTESTIKF